MLNKKKDRYNLIKRVIFRFVKDNFDKIHPDSLQITGIILKKYNRKKVVIVIELGRPGLLIGKGGRMIGKLKGFLCNYFEREVDVSVKDSELYKGI